MKLLIAALLCGVSVPAMAQHIRIEPYNETAVVHLTAQVGRSFDVKFGNDDRIKFFVFGKTDGPLTVPAGKKDPEQVSLIHVLPITPVEAGKTNLFVDTLLPDSFTERTYHFIVDVLPESAPETPDVIYEIRFTYNAADTKEGNPQAQQAAQVQAVSWKEKKAQADRDKAEARMRVDAFYGVRNWKYRAIGDASITPVKDGISDNGYLTIMRYPGNMEVPTVWVAEGGAWCEDTPPPESWLRSPERRAQVGGLKADELLQMNEVAEHIRLRLGGKTADISNCGFNPIGQPGTPDVVRVTTR